jgi:hypothetical protein
MPCLKLPCAATDRSSSRAGSGKGNPIIGGEWYLGLNLVYQPKPLLASVGTTAVDAPFGSFATAAGPSQLDGKRSGG